MCDREPDNPALERYARISEVLCQKRHRTNEDAWQSLIHLLHQWTEDLQLKKLSHYGLKSSGISDVVAHSRGSSMLTNPIVLTDNEISAILVERM
jgi:alcohol dehydrogenase